MSLWIALFSFLFILFLFSNLMLFLERLVWMVPSKSSWEVAIFSFLVIFLEFCISIWFLFPFLFLFFHGTTCYLISLSKKRNKEVNVSNTVSLQGQGFFWFGKGFCVIHTHFIGIVKEVDVNPNLLEMKIVLFYYSQQPCLSY